MGMTMGMSQDDIEADLQLQQRVTELRIKMREQGPQSLQDSELIFLAMNEQSPLYPSACVDWVDRDAIPLLRALAQRFGLLISATTPPVD